MNNIPALKPVGGRDLISKYAGNIYLHLALIFLAEFAAYSNLFPAYFLSDDFNLLIGTSRWLTPATEFFRPIPHLLIHLFYKLFGMNVFPYHLLSFSIHYLNAVLILLILKKMAKNSYIALIGSLFFAVNFLISEAVFWISALTTLLVTLFYLLTVYFYLNYLSKLKKKNYVWAIICLVLALLSKENAVTLPVLLFTIHFFYAGNMKWRSRVFASFKSVLPFILPALIYLVLKSSSLTAAVSGSALSLGYHNIRNVRHFLLSLFSFNPFFDLPFLFVDVSIINLFLSSPIKIAPVPVDSNFFVTLAVGAVILLLCLYFIIKGKKDIKLTFLAFFISMGPFIFVSSIHLPFRGHYMYPLRLYYLPAAFFYMFFALILYYGYDHLKKRTKSPRMMILLLILLTAVIAFSDVMKVRRRSDDWMAAGIIAQSVLRQLNGRVRGSPEGTSFVLFNLPDNFKGVYIFRNGLRSALNLANPGSKVKIEISKTAPQHYKISPDRLSKGNVVFINCKIHLP
jgi:hypothetical protein